MVFKFGTSKKDKDIVSWKDLYNKNNDNDQYYQNITKLIFKLDVIKSDMIIGSDLVNDLEIIDPYDNKNYDSTVINILSKHFQSSGAKILCKDLLLNPLFNGEILSQRITCLNKIESKQSIEKSKTLQNPHHEADLLWFFDQKEQTITDLLNTAFINIYGISDKLNNNETFLTSYNIYKIFISPSIGVLSPLIYVIIPFFIIKYKLGTYIKMSFMTYLKLLYKSIMKSKHMFQIMDPNTSGIMHKVSILSYIMSFIFYFQGLFNTFSVSNTTYKIVQFLSQKVINAIVQLKYYSKIVDIYYDISSKYQQYFFNTVDQDVSRETMIYLQNFNVKQFSIMQNFGSLLKFYKNFPKTEIIKLMNKYYFIDYLTSIVKIKNDRYLTYVNILPNDPENPKKPHINMQQAWHFCIDHNKAVSNDISTENIVLTGPNAGGKSTLIKTLSTNVLLAQTIGINSSKLTHIKPFYFINTQINIPDCKGIESLFEAEMNRCMYTLDTLKSIDDKPCLIVMDEIFNSTNMIEAVSGAYSILSELSNNDNCMIFITTHFLYLTKLSKSSTFVCKKMNVRIDKETNDMHYPYLLKNGVSRQYIALDLLRNKGFDKNIIENALKIKEKFMNHKST